MGHSWATRPGIVPMPTYSLPRDKGRYRKRLTTGERSELKKGAANVDDQEFFYRCKLALQKHWWQAKKPDVASIGRELSAVKQWRGRVKDDELLILALELYRGQPIAFLWGHKSGNHALLNRLLAKARQERVGEHGVDSLGDILNRAIREAS